MDKRASPGPVLGKRPQQTLYVPVEWLKKGTNEVVVLELIKPGQEELHSLEKPILSVLNK